MTTTRNVIVQRPSPPPTSLGHLQEVLDAVPAVSTSFPRLSSSRWQVVPSHYEDSVAVLPELVQVSLESERCDSGFKGQTTWDGRRRRWRRSGRVGCQEQLLASLVIQLVLVNLENALSQKHHQIVSGSLRLGGI